MADTAAREDRSEHLHKRPSDDHGPSPPPDLEKTRKKQAPVRTLHNKPPSKPTNWLSPKVYNPLRIARTVWRYAAGAKWLSILALLFFVGYIEISRQLFTLFTATDQSPHADLPPDLKMTHTWLSGVLGGVVDPPMAFVLLNIWNGSCLLLLATLLHYVIAATDDPEPSPSVPLEGEESQDPSTVWLRNPIQSIRKVASFFKSTVTTWCLVIRMDANYQSTSTFWKKWTMWTLVRTTLCSAQLVIAIETIRLTSTLVSLVNGSSMPIPSGPDISIVLPYLTESTKTITPGAAFLLLLFVISTFIPVLTASWYSLLHPRPLVVHPDEKELSKWQYLKGKFNTKVFRLCGPKTPPWLFEGVLITLILASFATCLVYFTQIVQYAASSAVVADNGLADYSGIMGANLIFGLFTLPMGWVGWTLWAAVRKRTSGSGKRFGSRKGAWCC